MTDKHTYDTEAFQAKVKISGSPITLAKVNEANFIFTLDKNGTKEEQPPQTGTATGFPKVAKCDFGPLAVDDNLDFYDVTYKVEVTPPGKSKSTMDGSETIRVWPKTAKITFTSDDGEAHKNVKFRILIGKKAKPLTSGENGVWEGDAPMKEYTIEVDSPWEKTDVTPTGRKREYKVEKKAFTAIFLSPDPDKPKETIKQYTNKDDVDPWTSATPHGSKITFEIASKNNVAGQNDTVFIECLFGRESDRDDPLPSLQTDNLDGAVETEDNGKKNKGKIKLDANKKAKFKVELGAAGGDTCTVKIGATEACGDAELKFENWRKLFYETVHPKATISSFGTFKDGLPGLSATMKKDCTDTMKEGYIELEASREAYFEAGAINNWIVVKATHLELAGASKKAVVLYDSQIDAIRDADANKKLDAETFSVYWTDFMVGGNRSTAGTLTREMPAKVLDDQDFPANRLIFEKKLTDGNDGITAVKWRVSKIKKGGVWTAVVGGDMTGNLAGKNVNTTVAADKRKDFIELKNWKKFKLKLPDTAATDPGKLLSEGGKEFKITVTIEYAYDSPGPLGTGYLGTVNLQAKGGTSPVQELTATTTHEMGHCMGQGYMEKAKDATWGRLDVYKVSGMPSPPEYVDDGLIYCRHGGQGVHCAHGLSKAKRGEDPIRDPDNAKCTMYHAKATNDPFKFCANCLKFIKAEKLDNVTRNWKT